MTQSLLQVPGFIRNEIRLSWRQQQGLFGKAGALFSPSIVISLYAGLHFVFALLHLTMEPNSGHTVIAHHAYGWALLGVWVILVAASVAPVAEMINGRGDWDFIVSSPFPLRVIVFARLLLIAVRASALPILLLTPAINVRALGGETGLLQVYPAMAALALSAAGASALLALWLPTRTSVARTKAYFTLVGLAMIGAIVAVSLLRSNTSFIATVIAATESSYIFSIIAWLGKGLFADLWSLFVISLIGAGCFFAALGPITARVLQFPQQHQSILMAQKQSSKFVFADSLLLATMKKEWRLARRDWRILLDFVRAAVVLSTILILVINEAQGSLAGAAATLSLAICAVMANDLSWRMASVEQLPDLISMSPVNVSIVKYKLIAASFPPLTLLIVLCLGLVFLAPQTAWLTLLFGVCAIGGVSLLNGRHDPLDGGVRGSRPMQSLAMVLIQALNVFSWSFGLYFVLTGLVLPDWP